MVPDYMSNDKEREGRTPAGQSKVGFEIERQLKRAPFKDIKQRLEVKPEKVFDVEFSLEKPKLEGFATEESSRPLSTEKSFPDPTTKIIYQSQPLRAPDYLLKGDKLGVLNPLDPLLSPKQLAEAKHPLELIPYDEEYTFSPKMGELRKRLRDKLFLLTPDEFIAELAEASPENPLVQELIARFRRAK
jgi:hypothetical protein